MEIEWVKDTFVYDFVVLDFIFILLFSVSIPEIKLLKKN